MTTAMEQGEGRSQANPVAHSSTEPITTNFERVRLELQERLEDDGVDIRIPHADDPNFLDFMTVFQRTHPHYAKRLTQSRHADGDVELPESGAVGRVSLRDRFDSLTQRLFLRQNVDGNWVLDKRKSGMWTATALMLVAGSYLVVSGLPPKTAGNTQVDTANHNVPQSAVPGQPGTDSSGADLGETNLKDGTASPTAGVSTNPSGAQNVDPASGTDPFVNVGQSPKPSQGGDLAPSSPQIRTDQTPPSPPQAFTTVESDPYAPASPTPITSAPVQQVSASNDVQAVPASSIASVPSSSATAANAFDNPFAAAPINSDSTPLASVSGAAPPVALSAPAPSGKTPSSSLAVDGSSVTTGTMLNPPSTTAKPLQTSTTPESFEPFDGSGGLPLPGSSPAGGEGRPVTSSVAATASGQINTGEEAKPATTTNGFGLGGGRTAVVYQRPSEGIQTTGGSASTEKARSALVMATSAQTQAADGKTSGAPARTALTMQTSQPAQRPSATVYTTQNNEASTTTSPSTVLAASATSNPQGVSTPSPVAQAAPAADAPPFSPTQLIGARLVTSIYSVGGQTVPVVAQVAEGNVVGKAMLNAQMARVEMQFNALVKNGKVYKFSGMAYQNIKGNLVSGLGATVKDVAPNLASNLIRSGINGLNTYAQQLAQSATTTVANGIVTSTSTPPDLLTVLRGQMAGVFALPQGQQTFVTVGQVPTGTDFLIMIGLDNPDQGSSD